jgi:hypothetical protein
VRQMAAPSRIDPCLHFLIRRFDFLRHTLSYSLSAADPGYQTVGRGTLSSLFSVKSVFQESKQTSIPSSRPERDH